MVYHNLTQGHDFFMNEIEININLWRTIPLQTNAWCDNVHTISYSLPVNYYEWQQYVSPRITRKSEATSTTRIEWRCLSQVKKCTCHVHNITSNNYNAHQIDRVNPNYKFTISVCLSSGRIACLFIYYPCLRVCVCVYVSVTLVWVNFDIDC